MAGKRKGLVSSINNFTVEELASNMLTDPKLESKIKLYRKNMNMNDTTREHAKLAYERFRTLRREKMKIQKATTAERVEAAKQARRKQWIENNPTSLRFKSIEEIVSIIETDAEIRRKVNSYLSQTNSNLSEEYKKRLRLAIIAYYAKNKPDSPKLAKHINLLNRK